MEVKGTKEETKNFSKSIMSTVVLLYFSGALIGTILVIISAIVDVKLGISIDTSMFVAYAAYLGGPTATAIGFYAWKSKAENVLKIGKSFGGEQVTEVVTAITQMEDN
ncbi:MAG: hypothetical protein RBT15_04775 [Gudongella sp.]|jgi:hypothetical protein|nr:hypothetical protein [Gudongella sp.]